MTIRKLPIFRTDDAIVEVLDKSNEPLTYPQVADEIYKRYPQERTYVSDKTIRRRAARLLLSGVIRCMDRFHRRYLFLRERAEEMKKRLG